jgi:hypothetical protein
VQAQRAEAEAYLISNISHIPATVGCHGRQHELIRAAGMAATVSPVDLLQAGTRTPEHLLKFNPFLSQQSCQHLHSALLLWLQLCVLEDRLGRLCKLALAASKDGAGVMPILMQELSVRRVYDVHKHPKWLVLEAEGQFQVCAADCICQGMVAFVHTYPAFW